MTQNLTDGPGGTIRPDIAAGYAKNWRDYPADMKLAAIGNIKGFVIPQEDIDDVFAIMLLNKGVGCRVYFGLDPGLTDVPVMRFMIVALDANGNDILTVPKATADDDGSGVFDFTRPCPTQCGEPNEMNGDGTGCATGNCEVHHAEAHEAEHA